MQILKIFFVVFVFQVNQSFGIHYGQKAQKDQFPYSVLLKYFSSFCSGALISDRHVLTAAHCLRNIRQGNKIKIDVGFYHRYRAGGKILYSDKYWMHENFTMPSAVYDIGIVELPEALVESDNIKWLQISTKLNAESDFEDKDVEVAGWGHTEFYHGISHELQYANMTLITLNECKKYKSHYVEDLNDDNICTERVKGAPCDGDSGAALVSKKTNQILGVLSYGKDAENGIDMGENDCNANVPVVFTRISSYIDWIKEKTGLNFN